VREHALTVPRTARYYTIGRATDPDEIWICCHGYGQLAEEFATRLRALDNGRRLVVVPEALSRFYLGDPDGEHGPESRVGATWMTRVARLQEIADYVRYLDHLCRAVRSSMTRPPAVVCALGFSQGAATASRWAALGEEPVSRLVIWGGVLPPDLDLHAFRERMASVDLTVVVGDRDAYASEDRVRDLHERLAGVGLPHRVLRFSGGHRLDDDTLRSLGDATATRPTRASGDGAPVR